MDIRTVHHATTIEQELPKPIYRKTPFNSNPPTLSEEFEQLGLSSTGTKPLTEERVTLISNGEASPVENENDNEHVEFSQRCLFPSPANEEEEFDDEVDLIETPYEETLVGLFLDALIDELQQRDCDIEASNLSPLIHVREEDNKGQTEVFIELQKDLATIKTALITHLKYVPIQFKHQLPVSYANLDTLLELARDWDLEIRARNAQHLYEIACKMIVAGELQRLGSWISTSTDEVDLLGEDENLLEKILRHFLKYGFTDVILEIGKIIAKNFKLEDKRLLPLLLLIQFYCEKHNEEEALNVVQYLLSSKEFKETTESVVIETIETTRKMSRAQVKHTFRKLLNEKTMVIALKNSDELDKLIDTVDEGFTTPETKSAILSEGIQAALKEQPLETPLSKKVVTLGKYIEDRKLKMRVYVNGFAKFTKNGKISYAETVAGAAPFPRIKKQMDKALLALVANKKEAMP